MNHVELIGRLTRDPVSNKLDSGTEITRFTLAVRKRFQKDGENAADFISCVCFGSRAEFAAKYFRQGDRVGLAGHIQSGSYERDGQRVFSMNVIADEIEFADGKKDRAPGIPAPEEEFMQIPEGMEEEMPFR
ncbi:MAG: single-stranded DNA-binding protein [Lachnospiraceae bacterium]|nr:single-stranded DNA-binding protein [Lachnospiraceae bacterium]